MAADVAGYTHLMVEDEPATVATIAMFRAALVTALLLDPLNTALADKPENGPAQDLPGSNSYSLEYQWGHSDFDLRQAGAASLDRRGRTSFDESENGPFVAWLYAPELSNRQLVSPLYREVAEHQSDWQLWLDAGHFEPDDVIPVKALRPSDLQQGIDVRWAVLPAHIAHDPHPAIKDSVVGRDTFFRWNWEPWRSADIHFSLLAPEQPGAYEVRLYANGEEVSISAFEVEGLSAVDLMFQCDHELIDYTDPELRAAAEQGDAYAQYDLGVAYSLSANCDAATYFWFWVFDITRDGEDLYREVKYDGHLLRVRLDDAYLFRESAVGFMTDEEEEETRRQALAWRPGTPVDFEAAEPGDGGGTEPGISDIIVVGNQTAQAYPFDTAGGDAPSGGDKTRRLIVIGDNLGALAAESASVKSASATIAYALRPAGGADNDPALAAARAATEEALRRAGALESPNQDLIAALKARREALAGGDDHLVVEATLKPGVTPGRQHLSIELTQGSWPLLFGDSNATLHFTRHDDAARAKSVPIFFPGDSAAVDLIFETDIPYDSIGLHLLHRTASAAEGEEAGEAGVLLARRLDAASADGGAIFRSNPIHLVSAAHPRRRPPHDINAITLEVRNGDKIGARLLDPAQARLTPTAVIAEIAGDPDELGELWHQALERVAMCDGDVFDGDPLYALQRSKRVSRVVIGELARFASPLAALAAELTGVDGRVDFNPSVNLHKGDHAAALLIRDELVVMMADLTPALAPLKNNGNGEATALREWALSSGQAGELAMLRHFAAGLWVSPLPQGASHDFRVITGDHRQFPGPKVNTWADAPLSRVISEREQILRLTDFTPERFDAWLDERIQAAAGNLIAELQRAIGRALNATCKLEELIVIAGQKAEPVVARIRPRLVRMVSGPGTPPSEHWAPDKLALGFVERLHTAGEAVAALEEYGAIDDAYKAMAVALVTAGAAGAISAAGYNAAAAGLLAAGDLADAAYFGAAELDRAVDSEAFYEFAEGASLILGDKLLLEAEDRRESLAMTLIGLIAPGIGAGLGLADLRYFANIENGRALLETRGADLLDGLDELSDLERTQIAAYFNDTLERADTLGTMALSETDRQAMDWLHQRTFAETESWAPPKVTLSDADTEALTTFTVDGSALAEIMAAVPNEVALIRKVTSPERTFDVVTGQLDLVDESPFAREVLGAPHMSEPTGIMSETRIVGSDGREIQLGRKLGKGSFSRVHVDPENPSVVTRVSEIPEGDRKFELAALDDAVGRQLLGEIEDADGYFRVTRRDGNPFVVSDATDPSKRYLIVQEENIASKVDGRTITDAKQRFKTREPTEAELLTMQLAVREINQNGLIWTDHKRANFDILPDPDSATGHRMVIFDTGGFKPMSGANEELRWRNARRWQQLFDGSKDKGEVLSHQVRFLYTIDDRAYGQNEVFYFSPGANRKRTAYLALNELDPSSFAAHVETVSQQLGETIRYAPPGR
jgi:hypothetical protein